MELYRKYRPQTLEELVGNESVKKQLRKMLDNDSIPHAIQLTGPAGCGKTTVARIIRKELGCDDYDYKEIDSVDMSGVDMVREVRRKMGYAPSKGKTRVYLWDENHRLSGTASDATLKMLEECPKHCYFIFATTEPDKLTKTFRSRCTHFAVEPLSDLQIAREVLYPVCRKEGKNVPKEVLKEIGRDSMGSSRSALVILDSIINLDEDEMMEAVKKKASEENEVYDLCRNLVKGDWKTCSGIVRNLKQEPETIRRAVLGYFTTVLLNSGESYARDIIVQFEKNYFDSGKAGLAVSVFDSCLRDEE